MKMNKKGVKMVISAAGMAIYLLCGGCKGQDMSDAERNMENENASEDEAIAETEDSSTVDYHTCPSGTVVDKALSEAEIDELFTAGPIPDEVFDRIDGISYVENDNIGREDLRYLRLLYYGFDDETHVGELITMGPSRMRSWRFFRNFTKISTHREDAVDRRIRR